MNYCELKLFIVYRPLFVFFMIEHKKRPPERGLYIIQFLGVIRYAPNAAPPMAATRNKISINLQKEQQEQLLSRQQMLSQEGSCEHYARALLPYQGWHG